MAATCSMGSPETSTKPKPRIEPQKRRPSIELQAVVHLDVPLEELTRRLLARGVQEGRIDDAENVVTHRLEVFAADTEPLLGFYRERGLVLDINGDQDVDRVFRAIVKGLDRERRRARH